MSEIKREEKKLAPRLGLHLLHPQDPLAQPKPRAKRSAPYKLPVRPDRSVIPLVEVPARDNEWYAKYREQHPLPPRPSPRPHPHADLLAAAQSASTSARPMSSTTIPAGLNFKNEVEERLHRRVKAVMTRLENLWNYPEYSHLDPLLFTKLNDLGDALEWISGHTEEIVGWKPTQRQIILNGLAAFGPISFTQPRKRYTDIVISCCEVWNLGFFTKARDKLQKERDAAALLE